MIHKLAYTIEMSTKISDEKQQKAAGISQLFSEIINKIDLFSDGQLSFSNYIHMIRGCILIQ